MYSRRSQRVQRQFKERCKDLQPEKIVINRMANLLTSQHQRLLTVSEEEAHAKELEAQYEKEHKVV